MIVAKYSYISSIYGFVTNRNMDTHQQYNQYEYLASFTHIPAK